MLHARLLASLILNQRFVAEGMSWLTICYHQITCTRIHFSDNITRIRRSLSSAIPYLDLYSLSPNARYKKETFDAYSFSLNIIVSFMSENRWSALWSAASSLFQPIAFNL